jgi:hypothetical protein
MFDRSDSNIDVSFQQINNVPAGNRALSLLTLSSGARPVRRGLLLVRLNSARAVSSASTLSGTTAAAIMLMLCMLR